jgi:F-type H+-transporting ATPase subunit delta
MADHSTIARPYARALFAVASSDGELGAWSDAVHAAAGVVSDPVARAYLARPALKARERADFVARVLEGTAVARTLGSTHGRNLLALLSENGWLAALPEIASQFDKLKSAAENKVAVRLHAASDVDERQVENITEALRKRLGRTVELEVDVNPDLVGGAIVRADDRVIDGSVKSRLERLAASLID